MAALKTDKNEAIGHLEAAVSHLEQSFDVRTPASGLQYWVASCRSLGEALISFATLVPERSTEYSQRATETLQQAHSLINQSEHPNQWGEIETQLSRIRDLD